MEQLIELLRRYLISNRRSLQKKMLEGILNTVISVIIKQNDINHLFLNINFVL